MGGWEGGWFLVFATVLVVWMPPCAPLARHRIPLALPWIPLAPLWIPLAYATGYGQRSGEGWGYLGLDLGARG